MSYRPSDSCRLAVRLTAIARGDLGIVGVFLAGSTRVGVRSARALVIGGLTAVSYHHVFFAERAWVHPVDRAVPQTLNTDRGAAARRRGWKVYVLYACGALAIQHADGWFILLARRLS
jgi:hypothetical protein